MHRLAQFVRPGLIALLLAASGLAWAGPTNDDCMMCHSDKELTREDGSNVGVDADLFGASIHGWLSCTDCHTDLAAAELPHESKLALPDCSACHAEAVALYDKGIHAQARAEGKMLPASCGDCHGAAYRDPITADFDLAGSFSIGMAEIDAGYIFMPLDAAQRFFELEPGQVTAIDVLTADPRNAPAIAAQIRKALGDAYKVTDWRQRNAAFVGALEVERTVMFFILTLIVLVAALNVVASFTMLVRSKARSIAILRTMGTERAGVLRIFLMAGGFVGLAGTSIGAAIGLVLALNAASIRSIFGSLQAVGIA